MYPYKFVTISLLSCIVTTPAHAQTYRCQQPNGIAAYQDTPCANGPQKMVNSPASGSTSNPNDEIAAYQRRLERQLAEAQQEMKAQDLKRKEEMKRFEAELPQKRAASAKTEADAIAKFNKDEAQKIADLRKCVRRDQGIDCSATSYKRLLLAMHRSDVEDILGAAKTQLIGTQELLYFTVPMLEGAAWRAARIQLKFGYDSSLPAGVRGATNRVTGLNIY